MPMPIDIRNFIITQIDYYIEEIDMYLLVAKEHCDARSLEDTTFGIILGGIYVGFIHACSTQSLSPNTDSIVELHDIIRKRRQDIHLAIQDSRQRCQI
ncbi:MAG: hypothetical protein F4Y18_07240 [Cenarchaeum sp. SB0663_bin_5]|nr:hypothetical protein [Cenarchaeum sp. SB0663_bin_5]MYH04056.1 hypothetical protein [Cenarchaeum sp. SB0675_bin_21]MYL12095.1 hypothetical protein [Cenarchaeum sp. SB0669_bin_11]